MIQELWPLSPTKNGRTDVQVDNRAHSESQPFGMSNFLRVVQWKKEKKKDIATNGDADFKKKNANQKYFKLLHKTFLIGK